MLGEHYVVMTVKCPRCKTKQKIHVAVRPGPTQIDDQTIPCIQCDNHFKVKIPDRIVGGPFPYSLAISFFEARQSLGAYRIPPETGLLIPSVYPATEFGGSYRWRQASVRFRICSIWNRRRCAKGVSMGYSG